jgi:hypothetical protein
MKTYLFLSKINTKAGLNQCQTAVVSSTRVLSYGNIGEVQKRRGINKVRPKQYRVNSAQSNNCTSYHKYITWLRTGDAVDKY